MTRRDPQADGTQPWAVSLQLTMPDGLDDDQAGAVMDALAGYSGVLEHSAPGSSEPHIAVTFDVVAAGAVAAADDGERVLRALLQNVGVPADGALTALEVLLPAAQEAANSRPAPTLLGVSEIAAILQVSRQRVDQLRTRTDFPEPLVILRAGPIWTEASLLQFRESWDRSPGRRAAHVGA